MPKSFCWPFATYTTKEPLSPFLDTVAMVVGGYDSSLADRPYTDDVELFGCPGPHGTGVDIPIRKFPTRYGSHQILYRRCDIFVASYLSKFISITYTF